MLTQQQLENVVVGFVSMSPDGVTEDEISAFVDRIDEEYTNAVIIQMVVDGELWAGKDENDELIFRAPVNRSA